jgi:hypothetical protein
MMNDVFMLLLVPVTMVFIYLFGKGIEIISECWHKWDKWIVWQTEDAYCQGRKCSKCGQQQIMQTRKVKDGHPNS